MQCKATYWLNSPEMRAQRRSGGQTKEVMRSKLKFGDGTRGSSRKSCSGLRHGGVNFVRSRSLLEFANGFLFSAFIAFAPAFTFPEYSRQPTARPPDPGTR